MCTEAKRTAKLLVDKVFDIMIGDIIGYSNLNMLPACRSMSRLGCTSRARCAPPV